MYSPATQVRVSVAAGAGEVSEDLAAGISDWALIMSSAAGAPGTSASSNWKLRRAAVYVLRRPERSAAYQVVRDNLEMWLAQRRVSARRHPG